MPEDDKRYKGKKVIDVLVTTATNKVTKYKDGSTEIAGIGEEFMVEQKRGCHCLNHIENNLI